MYSDTVQPVTLQFAEEADNSRFWYLILFFGAHVLLGLLMTKINAVATAHVLLTVVVGIYFAVFDSRVERVAYVGAYIVGAEVLWRMTGAHTFWETGKYASSIIFLIAMVRHARFKAPVLPTMYLALLIPSSLMVLVALGMDEARGAISFNLSGPIALAVSAAFFYFVRLPRKNLQRLLFALIAPVVAIAGLTLYGILSDPHIASGFRRTSNFAASGGFGPNQVSSILGFGVLLLLFLLFAEGANWWQRVFLWGCVLWLTSQCVLTFSRGGLYDLAVGIMLALPFLIKDPGTRVKLIVVAVSLLLVGSYVLLPRLDAFTRGRLSTRYESVDTTGRMDLVMADLEVWKEHPLLGVGPGQSEFVREWAIEPVAAHTEFTRLLAEHGVLGLSALMLLLCAGARRIVTAQSNVGKGLTAALVGWSLFNMLHAGMRIAAPSFAFGLAYATLVEEENLRMSFIVVKNAASSGIPDRAQVQEAYEQFSHWLVANRH
jgi:hypothetical protein